MVAWLRSHDEILAELKQILFLLVGPYSLEIWCKGKGIKLIFPPLNIILSKSAHDDGSGIVSRSMELFSNVFNFVADVAKESPNFVVLLSTA